MNNATGLLVDHTCIHNPTLAYIPTNPLDTPYPWYVWKTPDNTGPEAVVLKMKLFAENIPVSDNYCLTYFFEDNLPSYFYTLPIVSIIIDSACLYDYETGIYLPGITYDYNPVWTWWGGNSGNYKERGVDWERQGNITFFEPGGIPGFQQEIGLRINGGGTRIFPQKSLRVYARSEYGVNKIYYPVFPQKDQPDFKRLIISNNGQDFIGGGMNDVIVAALFNKLDLDLQEFRFCITYINGEYWGIQCIRERLDQYYLNDKYQIDEDNVDIVSGFAFAEEGDTIAFKQMFNFIAQHDLSQDANYDYIERLIDIDAYIDYNICKQYIGSTDWPGNNIECWKERTDGTKWRWFFFDNNGALINTNSNVLEKSMEAGGTGWPNPDWSTLIFRSLMKNETFKNKYFDRFNYLYYSYFQPEYMINIIDSISAILTGAMPDHIARWKYPASIQVRNNQIEQMKKFANERPAVIQQQIIDLFHHDYLSIDEVFSISENIKCFYSDGYINISNPLSNAVQFELYDIQGKLLHFDKFPPNSDLKVNAGHLRGIYLAVFTTNSFQTTRKLIIL